MFYLTRLLGKPVVDAAGEEIGTINDVAIATGEIFPRVTALAFVGPDKTPFMLSWRKFVEDVNDERVLLCESRTRLRFSYLQPDEVLLARDLLNKQIVDTQGMKVVRVNDLKLSESANQLRLLGAEVGVRGVLRGISPLLERAVERVVRLVGRTLTETIIAWNYMDLLDRDLSHVQLSVSHKRLHELHPADVADILETLSANQRGRVFDHLDNAAAALAISELEDEYQAQVFADLTDQRASDILEMMDPDDAADIIGDLDYDKAETLLRLMGVRESRQIRKLLGYKENSAGGIMTPEVTTVTEDMTVQQVIDHLRGAAAENESIYYVFVIEGDRRLVGVVSLRDLLVSAPETHVADIIKRDVITVEPDDDQEDVAETMSKYDLLALPVVDESGRILGIVTVDDALEVLEQESAEDLALATGSSRKIDEGAWRWLGKKSGFLIVWLVLGLGASLVIRAFASEIAAFIPMVFFLPLVVRLSEDISSRSLAMLIEAGAPEERPSFLRQMLVDVVVGLGLGLVTGLIVLAILTMLAEPLDTSVALAMAVGLTVLLMAAAGAVLPYLALRPGAGGWRAPSTLVSTGIAAIGISVYLLLATLLRQLVRM